MEIYKNRVDRVVVYDRENKVYSLILSNLIICYNKNLIGFKRI